MNGVEICEFRMSVLISSVLLLFQTIEAVGILPSSFINTDPETPSDVSKYGALYTGAETLPPTATAEWNCCSQYCLPVIGSNDTIASSCRRISWRTPPAVMTIGGLGPPKNFPARHASLPVILSQATMPGPSLPRTLLMRRDPSMIGGLTEPAGPRSASNSLMKFFVQRISPVFAFTACNTPVRPNAYSRSASVITGGAGPPFSWS